MKAVLQETSSWEEESLHKKEHECKAAGVLQRGEARGRRAEEHRAFREADHRASGRIGGGGHCRMCARGVIGVFWKTTLGGVNEAREAVQLVVWCMRPPTRVEESERDRVFVSRSRLQRSPVCVVVVLIAAVSSKCPPINGRR